MKMEDLTNNDVKEISTNEQPKLEPTNLVADNFWVIKDIPSKYKFYPEGTIIKGRPLKVLDVKLLATLDENNFNQIINDVLRRNIIGLDINELLVSDKMYILFWLRANTYKESGYTVDFTCSKCRKDTSYNFTLDTLNIISVKDDITEDKKIELPVSKDNITMRYERVKDEFAVEDFKNKSKDIYNEDILKLANVLSSINDNSDKDLKGKYKYLSELNPSDYAYIESYVKYMDIGISPVLSVKCNACGEPTLTGVTFSGDFFVPKYKFN